MTEPAQPIRIEPRWPLVLATLAVLAVLTFLPARIRLFPSWLPYAIGMAFSPTDTLPIIPNYPAPPSRGFSSMKRGTILIPPATIKR